MFFFVKSCNNLLKNNEYIRNKISFPSVTSLKTDSKGTKLDVCKLRHLLTINYSRLAFHFEKAKMDDQLDDFKKFGKDNTYTESTGNKLTSIIGVFH